MEKAVLKATEIIQSPYPDVIPATWKTIPEFIWSNLNKWKTAQCLVCGATGKSYSYEEVFTLSNNFAKNLSSIGITKGDVVSLILSNSSEHVISMFGIWETGATVQPLNPVLTQREIEEMLEDSGAKCIVTDCAHVANSLHTKVKKIIFVGNNGDTDSDSIIKFTSMIKEYKPDDKTMEEKNLSVDKTQESDIAFLIYSSGTTGKPKGVQRTHFAEIQNILIMQQPGVTNIETFYNGNEQVVYLSILSLAHLYALVTLLVTMSLGAKIILVPKFSPKIFIQSIKEYKPTMYTLVPYLLDFMVNNPDVKKEYFANTKMVSYGGAPSSQTVVQSFISKFGDHLFLNQNYGMTEIGVTHFSNPHIQKFDSIGRLGPNLVAKVANPETGDCVGANTPGELCIKSALNTVGYFKNEDATKSIFDSDGFLHTGDLASVDEDGWFYILDRIKDMIKVKGYLIYLKQVSPTEIENELRKLGGVLDVAVIGIKLDNAEAPRAFIVQSGKLAEKDIHHFLNDKVAPYKRLSGGVEFVNEIPRSAAGKILKKVLRQNYLANSEKGDTSTPIELKT